jgi:hypothetical protein
MKKLVVTILTLVFVTSLAHAKPRSLRTAYTISGIGAGTSALLITGAFLLPERSGDINYPLLWSGLGSAVVTPSLGNFYAGKYLTIGMGIRVAAGGFATYVALSQTQTNQCSDSTVPKDCEQITNTGMTLLGIAGIVFIAGAAYDFKTLEDDVRAYNAKHAFTWAPTLTPSPSGPGALLGIAGAF